MFKKSLLIALALLLLPASMVLSTGTAFAAPETQASLCGRVLSNAEVRAAVETSGSKVSLKNGVNLDPIDTADLIGCGKLWESNDAFLNITLMSFKDGHNLSSVERADVLSGAFSKGVMQGAFDSNEFVASFGSVLDDRDLTEGYYGTVKSKTYEVMTVTFVRANIFGIVLYATTGSNEGLEAWSSFGGQLAKLPE